MRKFYLFFLCAICVCATGFTKQAKIYDCFCFFNELDLLKVRFHELHNDVDHFVIVESLNTFSGEKKPLYFQENRNLFSEFDDKIIHIVSTQTTLEGQRNDIKQALVGASNDDIIIISDADQIINSKKIKEIRSHFEKGNEIVQIELRSYKWFINRWDPELPFCIVIALQKRALELLSSGKITPNNPIIRDAGWHFTNMGWVDGFFAKSNAISKNEINKNYKQNAKDIITQAKSCILSDVDESYPKYILENLEYFKKKNFIDDNVRFAKTLRLMNSRQRQDKALRLISKN